MTLTQTEIPVQLRRFEKRVGYGVALVINLVLLLVVQNIFDWGWLPFLTEEFATVVPWISFSLFVSAAANLIYVFSDRYPIKSVGQIGMNLVILLASYQIFQVYPFDFSAHDFNWGFVATALLILAMAGAGIGILTETHKLATGEPTNGKEVA